MVVMMPSPAETEDNARTIAVVGVAAMAATVPITAVAMAIAAVVNRLCHRALASRRFEQIQPDRRRVGRSCRKREQAQRDGSTRDHEFPHGVRSILLLLLRAIRLENRGGCSPRIRSVNGASAENPSRCCCFAHVGRVCASCRASPTSSEERSWPRIYEFTA